MIQRCRISKADGAYQRYMSLLNKSNDICFNGLTMLNRQINHALPMTGNNKHSVGIRQRNKVALLIYHTNAVG